MVVEAVRGMVYPEVRVRPSVPDVVIGEPEIDRPVGVVMATEVTDPFPEPFPLNVFQSVEERQPACEPEAVLHEITPAVSTIGVVALNSP
jgi:hypothetical protein